MKQSIQLTISAVVIFLLSIPLQAATLDQALLDRIASVPEDSYIDVIVRFNDKVNPNSFNDSNRNQRTRRLVSALKGKMASQEVVNLKRELRTQGAQSIKDLWITNGLSLSLRVDRIAWLARRTYVESISLDANVVVPASNWLPEQNLQAVGADTLWAAGYDGTGIVVASMDTGVEPSHLDLSTRYRGGSNSWYNPYDVNSTSPYDSASASTGHGTNVMGVLVGGNASGDSIGMAPGAQWIAVKIFNDQGLASLSAIHAGFQWLLDPDSNPNTDDAPDIVNNSWYLQGTQNSCDTEFANDIAVMKTAGIALVFAAGNTGPNANSSVSPANNPGAFSVGAVDSNLAVIDMSARGSSACGGGIFPDVVAPGQSITTSAHTSGLPVAWTTQVTGTSFAAPHVAGGMALLKQAFPNVEVSLLEEALRQSAADLGAAGPDNDSGYGMIDLQAAYNWLVLNSQPGQLDFENASYSVDENAGTITVNVIRSGGSAGDITVDYATSDGTALAAEDYQQASGTLTFLDGETSQSFTVTILDDTVFEGDETLDLTLSNATGGASLGAQSAAGLTIVEDDPADGDGDGFTSSLDCDDADPTVYPGAMEIKHDGIDQDCNGYDLTLEITRARYISSSDKLIVWTTSGLADAADLRLIIYRAAGGSGLDRSMRWVGSKNRWQKYFNNFTVKFGSAPVSITVYGVEGQESIAVEQQ
ncbi:MAG: S8 family serine peptidase [Candidatus Thiodiazotropha sp.]|nr:S8 family serine peptidase [Candidatus Thiodiazotropha taylori]MBT3057578.1 S8 family serine peptidase [Candidatus Thiodiazotropha sp. (ex Lucina pensylvanica)]PUB76279.1 MAG: hypothetical protein DBP03_04770 [gamma proteobacterium symbiont of Ctena orbiculata]